MDEARESSAKKAGTQASAEEFSARTEKYRRELHVHCYRMVGSYHEAEDMVQETYLRAWRAFAGFSGSGLRAWMYRIATNACLDAIRQTNRKPTRLSPHEVPWLEPYPDQLLDLLAPAEDEPETAAVARETIELGFLVTLQFLPARQRAVLVLRDVLGWPNSAVAGTLGISAPAANSALQRARGTLHAKSPRHANRELNDTERELLAKYVDTHTRSDVAAMAELVAEDIRVTMPPAPMCYLGRASLGPLFERAFGSSLDGTPIAGARPMGAWRLFPTTVNRMPAAVSYLREPGERTFKLMKLDVLRMRGRKIVEITTFNAGEVPELGFAPTLAP